MASPMIYRFDGYELDTGTMELRHGNGLVAMEPQVFDVLSYLVEHRSRVVTKDELIEHIWPERFISEAALSSRVMSARKAIGDTGNDQRLVRTVRGRGFRFVGDVSVVPVRQSEDQAAVAVEEEPAGPAFEQEIRFCTTADGTRVAYAISGSGPPLVKAANWLTHLDFDPVSPVWGHVWRDLGEDFQLIRYDGRGSGLSDRDMETYSFDAWVDDLEAVVDAVGVERFPLLGISQGGAIAVEYAIRHPERVSHLVMLGAYSRGRLHRSDEWRDRHVAMRTLIAQDWGKAGNPFAEIFSLGMIPDGTDEQRRWLTDLQRESASTENALRFHETSGNIDISELLPKLRVPALVLHARGDKRVEFEEGRRLAGLIPGARFVPLDSNNHLLQANEPAWQKVRSEIRAFVLGGGAA